MSSCNSALGRAALTPWPKRESETSAIFRKVWDPRRRAVTELAGHVVEAVALDYHLPRLPDRWRDESRHCNPIYAVGSPAHIRTRPVFGKASIVGTN